jgi:hypothetical protein
LSIARTPGNDHRAASRARRRAIVLPRASQIAYFGAIALSLAFQLFVQRLCDCGWFRLDWQELLPWLM